MKVNLIMLILCMGLSTEWGLSGDALLRILQQPRVKALLDTIAYAEGTLKYGNDGYRLLFGGNRFFTSFESHPRVRSCLNRKGKELCTTAAGRYQIQWPTWDYFMHIRKINKACGDMSFSPLNQDRVALQAVIDCGALSLLDYRLIPFSDMFARLGTIWSSMPGAKWGYVVYTVRQLKDVFEGQLKKYI